MLNVADGQFLSVCLNGHSFDSFHTMLMAMNRTVCLAGCIFILEVQLKDDKISFQMCEGIGRL